MVLCGDGRFDRRAVLIIFQKGKRSVEDEDRRRMEGGKPAQIVFLFASIMAADLSIGEYCGGSRPIRVENPTFIAVEVDLRRSALDLRHSDRDG